jgi:hypothetical protein
MGKSGICENEYDKASEHGVTKLKDHAEQMQPDYVEPTSRPLCYMLANALGAPWHATAASGYGLLSKDHPITNRPVKNLSFESAALPLG